MKNPKLNQDTVSKVKNAYGKNIRKIRKSIEMSQAELAYRCNTDTAKISRTENGKYDIRPETIMALANALDIDIKDIIPLKLLNDLKSEIWL